MSLIRFSLEGLEQMPFERGAPSPQRLIQGAPQFRTWTFEESGDGKLFAGVWESTPGIWRVEYDEWEFCSIIHGVSIVTRDGGVPLRVSTGDTFVLQSGFCGSWEVVETTRKHFVVRTD